MNTVVSIDQEATELQFLLINTLNTEKYYALIQNMIADEYQNYYLIDKEQNTIVYIENYNTANSTFINFVQNLEYLDQKFYNVLVF